jgi:hypothetical protein
LPQCLSLRLSSLTASLFWHGRHIFLDSISSHVAEGWWRFPGGPRCDHPFFGFAQPHHPHTPRHFCPTVNQELPLLFYWTYILRSGDSLAFRGSNMCWKG